MHGQSGMTTHLGSGLIDRLSIVNVGIPIKSIVTGLSRSHKTAAFASAKIYWFKSLSEVYGLVKLFILFMLTLTAFLRFNLLADVIDGKDGIV